MEKESEKLELHNDQLPRTYGRKELDARKGPLYELPSAGIEVDRSELDGRLVDKPCIHADEIRSASATTLGELTVTSADTRRVNDGHAVTLSGSTSVQAGPGTGI